MNIFQTLNTAVAVGTIAALVAGSFRTSTQLLDRPLAFWLFLGFLFLFRLKMFFDDYKYFQSPETKTPHFKIGFIAGAVSWMFWLFAANSVGNLQDAYFLAGAAISVSTVWIVAVALKSGAYKEQYIWLGTNGMYVLLLWAAYRRNAPEGDAITWLLLGVLLAIVLADWTLSSSLPELE